MKITRVLALSVSLAAVARLAAAQPPAPPPPPVWETQVGASFVGASGNTETSTFGGDFAARRQWPLWQVEAQSAAIRTSDRGVQTGARYLASLRGKRRLTDLLSFTGGERAERDRFAGIDFRNVLDGGVSWALVRTAGWTLDAVTSLAWLHEQRTVGSGRDNPNAIYQALSRIPIGAAGDTRQRVAVYQDFRDTSAYRTEAEVTAQAAMNSRLALKLGYLMRYANDPVPGFLKTDNTVTASVVLRWESSERTPSP
jgi:putative salt-induced outer membrane protein YdiY